MNYLVEESLEKIVEPVALGNHIKYEFAIIHNIKIPICNIQF